MKNKKLLSLVILFMTVGIAAVATNTIISGSTTLNKNTTDYVVYFSDAYVNGVKDTSIITDNDKINFNTTFQTIGDTYTIDYVLSNESNNYDANIGITCTESNTYLQITNTLNTPTNITAKGTKTGVLEVKLIKSYTGDSDYNQTITCSLTTNAVERNTLGS